MFEISCVTGSRLRLTSPSPASVMENSVTAGTVDSVVGVVESRVVDVVDGSLTTAPAVVAVMVAAPPTVSRAAIEMAAARFMSSVSLDEVEHWV